MDQGVIQDFPDGEGLRRILGVMYNIGKINTGVRPGLGGTSNFAGWGWVGGGLDNALWRYEIPSHL